MIDPNDPGLRGGIVNGGIKQVKAIEKKGSGGMARLLHLLGIRHLLVNPDMLSDPIGDTVTYRLPLPRRMDIRDAEWLASILQESQLEIYSLVNDSSKPPEKT